jgi:hypothetical protein
MLSLCSAPKRPDRVVIGRAVGDPEDTVKVQGSLLYLRGRLQESEGDCSERSFSVEDPETGNEVEQTCTTEVANGMRHSRGNSTKKPDKPDFETTVGEGEFVLVSDNRLYPYDFRDYGAVDRETCKEAVIFRLIGADGFGSARRFTYIR